MLMTPTLSLSSLVPTVADPATVKDRLQSTTFVGIDFGTSTTVASFAVVGDSEVPVRTRPIPIRQALADGRTFEHHLVPTVVAWFEGRLLIGAGAAEVQHRLRSGIDVWSSFKMDLGVDLGPRYYNTALPRGHAVATIESPRDAAAVFLRFLRGEIERFIEQEGLPRDVRYVVSIPASFEANQRQDLLSALNQAGVETAGPTFIDEPNAAFLSYLAEANINTLGGYRIPRDSPLHVLIFDFGAGTCDISVLEIGQGSGAFYSKNLAISRFEALGGDDVDRAVVYQVLLPAMLEQSGKSRDDVRTADLTRRVVPGLMRPAERLKILLCKQVAAQAIGTRLPVMASSDETISLPVTVEVTLPQEVLRLEAPSMSYRTFGEVMGLFTARPGTPSAPPADGAPVVVSVFEPVQSALLKAGLEPSDLDLVLLVGGSAENPYVQTALHDYFEETEVEIPSDLRAHVSTGAAVHALLLRGLGIQTIRPITSEPILAVTRDESVRTLVRAGTEIPCPPIEVADLLVATEGQDKIQIPISVSSPAKVLLVIEIDSYSPAGFRKGTPVRVTCELTHDKSLCVTANVSERETATATLHPFANRELSPRERAVLEAEKVANTVAAQNGGRPSVAALLQLSEAYANAGEYARAAETLEVVQIMDRRADYANAISCHYSRAGRLALCDRWNEIAYERDRTPATAHNVALTKLRAGDREGYARYMEEALEMDPGFNPSRVVYGSYLKRRGEARGEALLKEAYEALTARLDAGLASTSDYSYLAKCATALGLAAEAERARSQATERTKGPSLFDQDRLLVQNLDLPVPQS